MKFRAEAFPFKILFDEHGVPFVDTKSSHARVKLWPMAIVNDGWKLASDMSAVIIEQSDNAVHIGVAPDKWLRAFCEKNSIGPLSVTTRHLRARESFGTLDGAGFISGVLVRDVA